nr:helix-turn-helix transcriptional regulator [Clostridium neonatale]
MLSDDTEEQLIDNSNNIEINVSKEYTYTHKASLLGDNIKRIRLSKGIGLNEVARRANITGGYLSSIENNKRTNIGAEILEAIANAIGVSVSDFYTNSENSIKTNENNIAMNACNKLKAHNELTLGENLKNIMKEKGVTSKELAERVGVSQVHISYILNNKRDPSVDLLEKIADILNVSVSDFYLGEISENKIDSDIVRIERARNKMPQEDKENMMRVLEAAFGKYFKD